MMKRRSFLVGASALMLGQLLSGCNQKQASLNVQLLKDSIPPQLVSEFEKQLKLAAQLDFAPESRLQDLFEYLKIWKKQADKKVPQQKLPLPFIGRKIPDRPNLVTLGDYWLESAIEQNLIQPLNLDQLEGWQKLPPQWQAIVKRDALGQLKPDGQVWGAPYRWGTTVIAYRRDKFQELGWTPQDWSDLWRPELRDRISLLDQPREVIGLTLKKLGFSYNTQNLSQIPNLEKELLALHQQVKYYSSDRYLEPLLMGDTWLALGWSTEVLSVRSSYRNIDAVVPYSGTALWADVWVQPVASTIGSQFKDMGDESAFSSDTRLMSYSQEELAQTPTSPTPSVEAQNNDEMSLIKPWIEFCWQPQIAREISVLTNAASPIILSMASEQLPKSLRENQLLLPDASVLKQSEFIKPLSKEVYENYLALWKKIRTS
jgi:putative spermidine/putrescine transport system substrate-binding protein